MRVILLALCTVVACAGRLRAPNATKAVKDNKTVEVAVKPHNNTAAKEGANHNVTITATKNVTQNASKVPKNLTADEQISALNKGLETIMKLKSVFTAEDSRLHKSPHSELEKFAQGAMSNELSSKDSPVWGAIENMLAATARTTAEMKGKSKVEQDKMMDNLEQLMNDKAETLKNVTDRAGEIQEQHNEEYLLGVLMQHQNDWSIEKQLNATKGFETTCQAARKLVKSYNKSQPLAPQLAALMDHKKVPAAAKVAAEKSAAKMLLQLVSSIHRA